MMGDEIERQVGLELGFCERADAEAWSAFVGGEDLLEFAYGKVLDGGVGFSNFFEELGAFWFE